MKNSLLFILNNLLHFRSWARSGSAAVGGKTINKIRKLFIRIDTGFDRYLCGSLIVNNVFYSIKEAWLFNYKQIISRISTEVGWLKVIEETNDGISSHEFKAVRINVHQFNKLRSIQV